MASSLIDKLGVSRAKGLTMVLIPGIVGSLAFALPHVIDQGLTGNGTLGLTLLDIVDHWAFRYSLLIGGFFECVMIGWVLGADKLRTFVNEHSKFTLGKWFNVQIKFVIPVILGFVILGTLWQDLGGAWWGEGVAWWDIRALWANVKANLYGSAYDMPGFAWLPAALPVFWILATLIMSFVLTNRPTHEHTPHNVSNLA